MKIKKGLELIYQAAIALPEEDPDGWNSYAKCISDFAEQWAEAMEKAIEEGKGRISVESCAESTMKEVDARPEFGITGNQYGHAVALLAGYWILGDPLRKWHNKKYNHDGEGTVNPAVLVIGACE